MQEHGGPGPVDHARDAVQTRRRASRRRLRLASEVAVLVVVAALGYLLARWLDLAESVAARARGEEWIELDELLVVLPLCAICLAAFMWGHYRQAQGEAFRLSDTQLRLAETLERYRSLFEYNPQPVFAFDVEGRYVEANPAGELLTGKTVAELRTMTFKDVVAPDDLVRVAAGFEEVLERHARQLETALVRPDGTRVDVVVTGLPIVVEGEVVGVYVVSEDVTEDKRIRRELARALRDAEAASEAKSMFLANMSHEVRTPLTTVIGATELLAEADLAPVQARLVELATRNGRSLLRLVNDLLDFSRIEAGAVEIEDLPFDLSRAVRDAVAPFEAQAAGKGLRLSVTVDPGLPRTVRGDAGRLGQVVANLVGNAVKFTEHGGIDVTAAAAGADGEGTGVALVLAVADSGIGIAPEDQGRLFESFAQADPTSTRRYGGAGLGLTISQQLVALMGGTVDLASRPGLGSTFRVRLPLRVPAVE